MKKSFIVLILVLALVLAACSSPSPSPAGTSAAVSQSAAASTAAASAAPSDEPQAPSAVVDGVWSPKNAFDLSKKVELNLYFAGDEQIDFQKVQAEFNKMLEEKINTTMNITFLTWADTNTKYPLVLASGEQIDLIFAAAWLDFYNLCYKNAYLPLEDHLDTYMPLTMEQMNPEAFKEATVNGHTYMVPSDVNVIYTEGYVTRGDLREKYGVPDITSLDVMEQYLQAVKDNEPAMVPWDVGGQDLGNYGSAGGIAGWGFEGFYFDDPTCTLISLAETPEYAQYVERMYTWAQKGFWTKGALVNKVSSRDTFKNGKSATCLMNTQDFKDTYATMNTSNPEWKVEWWEVASKDKKIRPRPYIQGGAAVPTTAKDITRSLIALETIRQDQELFDLNFYGIEGVHWTVDGEGNVTANSQEYLPGASTGTAAWRMDRFIKPIAGAWDQWPNLQEDWFANRAVYNPIPGFVFNSEALKNELAAIANVETEYAKPLSWGMVDPAKGLPDLIQKLKDAGIERVYEEKGKQIADFAAANGISLQ